MDPIDPNAGGSGGLDTGATTPEPQPAAVANYQPDTGYKFNPGNYGYTFRGGNVYPQSKDDLTELLQFGHSWRHNRPQFEQQQQEMKANQEKYQRYMDLENALNQAPDFAQKIWGLYEEHQNQAQAQPQNQLNLAQTPEFTQLNQTVEMIQNSMADKELETELSQMMSNHKEIDWNKDTGEGTPRMQLLRFMRDNKVNNPEHAYWALYGKQAVVQGQFQAAGKTTQQIQNQHRQGVVTNGQAAPATQPPEKARTLEQAEANAMKELGLN